MGDFINNHKKCVNMILLCLTILCYIIVVFLFCGLYLVLCVKTKVNMKVLRSENAFLNNIFRSQNEFLEKNSIGETSIEIWFITHSITGEIERNNDKMQKFNLNNEYE